MLDLLFNPNGKIGYKALLMGGAIVILIGLLKNLSPLLFGENAFVSLLGLVIAIGLIYCWVVLWMKRYRSVGKDPVWCLLPIFIFGVVYVFALGFVFWDMLAFAINAGIENPNDQAAVESAMEEYLLENTNSVVIKSAIYTAITSAAVMFIFNLIIGKEQDIAEDFS